MACSDWVSDRLTQLFRDEVPFLPLMISQMHEKTIIPLDFHFFLPSLLLPMNHKPRYHEFWFVCGFRFSQQHPSTIPSPKSQPIFDSVFLWFIINLNQSSPKWQFSFLFLFLKYKYILLYRVELISETIKSIKVNMDLCGVNVKNNLFYPTNLFSSGTQRAFYNEIINCKQQQQHFQRRIPFFVVTANAGKKKKKNNNHGGRRTAWNLLLSSFFSFTDSNN